MAETLNQNGISQMDELLNGYDEDCHEVLFRGEDDEEAIGFDVVRQELVDKGMGIVQTVEDCDRILSELDPERYKYLRGIVLKRRDSIEFSGIIGKFDTIHQGILGENNSSCEDDEELERVRSDELRNKLLPQAIAKATTREECLQVLGRTHEKNAYIRGLVAEKMASFPIETRKA